MPPTAIPRRSIEYSEFLKVFANPELTEHAPKLRDELAEHNPCLRGKYLIVAQYPTGEFFESLDIHKIPFEEKTRNLEIDAWHSAEILARKMRRHSKGKVAYTVLKIGLKEEVRVLSVK